MNTDMTTPCPNCPFRTDIPAYLRKARAEEIIRGITEEDGTFSCHKTVDYDSVDEEGESCPQNTDQTNHCAGAMILLEKMEQPNQWMRWMERLGFYDHTKMDMDAPVFDTPEEFIDAQPQ